MSTDDGSFGHANTKTPRPNIQLDKATLTRLNQLSYKNEALANCMCKKLEDHAWGWDTAKSLCEKEIERTHKVQKEIDQIHKDAKHNRERAAREQIKRAIQTDKEEKKRKVALDQRIKEITRPEPSKMIFTPKVLEHAYCCFCDSFHPTVIQVGLGDFRNFSLDSYHVSAYMTVDNEGYDRKPTDRERCIQAIMENRGCDQDEAERKCDQLLNDPLVINRYIRNPKHEQVTKQTKEDVFVADMVAKQNIHPSIPQAIYKQDQDRRTQFISYLLNTGRLGNRNGKFTTFAKSESQLETCIKEHMLEDGMSYEEAHDYCKHKKREEVPESV